MSLEIASGDFLRLISGVFEEIIDFLKLETNLEEKVLVGKMD